MSLAVCSSPIWSIACSSCNNFCAHLRCSNACCYTMFCFGFYSSFFSSSSSAAAAALLTSSYPHLFTSFQLSYCRRCCFCTFSVRLARLECSHLPFFFLFLFSVCYQFCVARWCWPLCVFVKARNNNKVEQNNRKKQQHTQPTQQPRNKTITGR